MSKITAFSPYKGGHIGNDEMEQWRELVHERLCREFALQSPLAVRNELPDYGQLNEQYINSRIARNAQIGKPITTIEACMVACVSRANGYSFADSFGSMIQQCEVHYNWLPSNLYGGLDKYKPSRQLLEKIVKAFSPRNNLLSVHMTPSDLFKMYNSVYKMINMAHWTARDAVTAVLNDDIDNVHLHSSVLNDRVVLHMSTKLGIDVVACKQKLAASNVAAIDVLRYTRFVAAVRGHRRKIRLLVQNALSQHTDMRGRLNSALWDVANCAPKNWDTHLTGLPKILAQKKFPAGSLVAIELEFGCRDGSDLQSLDESNYPEIQFVQWKGDGSVGSANGDGMCVGVYQEVNIMFNPNDQSGWNAVEKCVDFLRSKGAMVNTTCGMHIHIDTRDLTDRAYSRRVSKFLNAYRAWAKYVVARNRAHGHYCSVTNHPRQRYCAINSQCRAEHRTLEVRIGHGTLNIHKIKAWVAFNRWIMTAKEAHLTDFDKFMQSDCPHIVKAFIMGRMFKFADTWASAGDNMPKTLKQSVENTSDTWAV